MLKNLYVHILGPHHKGSGINRLDKRVCLIVVGNEVSAVLASSGHLLSLTSSNKACHARSWKKHENIWKHLKTLALTQLPFALDGESSALLGGVIFKSPATTAQGSVHVPCNFTMFHKHATQQRSPGKTARRHVEPPVAKRRPYYAFHIGSNWLLTHLHGLHQSGCLIQSRYCFRPRPKDTWYFGCGVKIEIWAWPASSSNFAESWKNGTNVYS